MPSGHLPRNDLPSTDTVKNLPMSCGEACEKLPLYVGGDLDPEVLEAVSAHLQGCRGCAALAARALRARQELVRSFRQPMGEASAPGLWPEIRSALRAEGLLRESAAPLSLPAASARGRRSRWAWALVPLAAAAALVLVTRLGTGGLERAPQGFPLAEAPSEAPLEGSGHEVVFTPEPPAGGLRRLAPSEVQPLRAFQPAPEQLTPSGAASLAGFGRVK